MYEELDMGGHYKEKMELKEVSAPLYRSAGLSSQLWALEE